MPQAEANDTWPGDGSSPVDTAILRELGREFPQFAIWREIMPDRTRYNAKRTTPGSGLHSVVTADIDEMRVILTQARAEQHP